MQDKERLVLPLPFMDKHGHTHRHTHTDRHTHTHTHTHTRNHQINHSSPSTPLLFLTPLFRIPRSPNPSSEGGGCERGCDGVICM